ncbi:class I SAM-dependent methyltransferase [Candidatus Woesearchaeota archaeon]|nr:class I SAM-dependent methyltransferase [Candidatus Woesearchaeota archaeon]
MAFEIKEELMEKVPCNLCGADDYEIIYSASYDKISQQELAEKFRSSGDELLLDQLVQCKRCGFKYINPRIRQELILKGYSEGTDENFISQADARELTFDKCLEYIEKFTEGKKGKLYDVGTAGGSFLQAAKKRGWEIYGSEPNRWLCAWAKKHYGFEILAGDIFAYPFPDKFFEMVTLWDVLEHVADPSKNLKEISRILQPGGLLVVNYPDIGSWLSKAMRKKWIFLLSVHLFYFERETITRMLEKNGFEVIKIKPHFQRLGLGYLTYRAKTYSNFLGSVGNWTARKLKITDWQIPYWLGQTLVIARKK